MISNIQSNNCYSFKLVKFIRPYEIHNITNLKQLLNSMSRDGSLFFIIVLRDTYYTVMY